MTVSVRRPITIAHLEPSAQVRLKGEPSAQVELKIAFRTGLFQAFWEKAPSQNWEMIDLTSKLGEINDIYNITRLAKYILKIKLF